MAIPDAMTYYGAVATINSVAIQDATVELTVSLERPVAEEPVWTGKVAAVGPPTGSGSGTVIYDETAASPYQTIKGEWLTPTAGGIAMVFQPKGVGAGNEQWLLDVVISKIDLGGGGEDIQKVAFEFTCTGTVTNSVQAT